MLACVRGPSLQSGWVCGLVHSHKCSFYCGSLLGWIHLASEVSDLPDNGSPARHVRHGGCACQMEQDSSPELCAWCSVG